MGSDPQYIKFPELSLAQHIFTLTNPYSPQPARQNGLKKLQDAISEHKMAPLYRYLAHPTEGILNPAGEGSVSRSSAPSARQLNGAPKLSSGATATVDFPWDEKLYESMKEENKTELDSFQKEEEEAAENAGETELQAARGKRAEFWARVGDKVCVTSLITLFLEAKAFRTKRLPPTKLYSRKQASWVVRSTLFWL